MAKTISVLVKEAMVTALGSLPPTNDGTEVLQVVTSGDDAFDQYPTIRVLPQDYRRLVDAERRVYEYTMTYVVSVYLELNNEQETPDTTVIDTMQELVDLVFETLDTTDWLDDVTMDGNTSVYVAQNDTPVIIDTVNSKTGIALYADIAYSVTYKKPF